MSAMMILNWLSLELEEAIDILFLNNVYHQAASVVIFQNKYFLVLLIIGLHFSQWFSCLSNNHLTRYTLVSWLINFECLDRKKKYCAYFRITFIGDGHVPNAKDLNKQ